jgi:hypothetical protein
MATNYADKSYVIVIPRIPSLNGHGSLKINRVVASDPETAVRDYIRREDPLYADEILAALGQRNATLSAFAFRAPSHDIPRPNYTQKDLAEQNRSIAEGLAQVCDRDFDEVHGRINSLLRFGE